MSLLAVTGMHRSGTSLVANLLFALGWSVGAREDLMPPKPDNPRGFFEHLPAVRINNRLLYRMGGSWDRPPALAPGWEHDDRLDDLRAEAGAIAANLVATGTPRVLMKDPRLSLTLPFWRTVTDVERSLLVLRHPMRVCRSLTEREQDLSMQDAAGLWIRYVTAALSSDERSIVISVDDLVEEPREGIRSLAASLGRPTTDADVERAHARIDEGMWGRTSQPHDLGETPGPLRAAEAIYHALLGEDAVVWRSAFAMLTPRATLGALEVASRDSIRDLRSEIEELRATRDRIRDARDTARELHARMTDQRDVAVTRMRALEAEVKVLRAARDGT